MISKPKKVKFIFRRLTKKGTYFGHSTDTIKLKQLVRFMFIRKSG